MKLIDQIRDRLNELDMKYHKPDINIQVLDIEAFTEVIVKEFAPRTIITDKRLSQLFCLPVSENPDCEPGEVRLVVNDTKPKVLDWIVTVTEQSLMGH